VWSRSLPDVEHFDRRLDTRWLRPKSWLRAAFHSGLFQDNHGPSYVILRSRTSSSISDLDASSASRHLVILFSDVLQVVWPINHWMLWFACVLTVSVNIRVYCCYLHVTVWNCILCSHVHIAFYLCDTKFITRFPHSFWLLHISLWNVAELVIGTLEAEVRDVLEPDNITVAGRILEVGLELYVIRHLIDPVTLTELCKSWLAWWSTSTID